MVLKGHKPGVYTDWEECSAQVRGFEKAVYKSYESQSDAAKAWQAKNLYAGMAKTSLPGMGSGTFGGTKTATAKPVKKVKPFIKDSVSVDAACSGNPGPMEYKGIDNLTGEQLFHFGPVKKGTNNIGEFLAIVHALAMLKAQGSLRPVYSDSVLAMSWVKQKKVRSNLPRTADTESLWVLLDRAVVWLHNNTWQNPLLKWETTVWGENPADFGRKG